MVKRSARTLLRLPAPAVVATAEEPLRMNLHYGATPAAHAVYHMHMLVLWVCTLIGIAVFAVMIWSLIRHRRSRVTSAADFSGNTRLEIAWTVVPVLILVAIAVPATTTLLDVNALPTPDVTVDIHGSQWRWHYAYAGLNIGFFSNLKDDSRSASRKGASTTPAAVAYYLRDVDHPLVLPVGKHVRLRITSDDVIHSWWVPDFGFKRDAIPGFVNEVDILIDRPGTYRGQCAELCGAGHAFMPIVVDAVSPAQFAAWTQQTQSEQASEEAAASKPWNMQLAMNDGKKLFDSVCAACHQSNGKGIPGTFPALDGSAVVTGPLQAHLKFVIHGSPRNPVMRPFGKEMNDRQLAAVLTYERNAWSNHTGDLVTAQQVEAAR